MDEEALIVLKEAQLPAREAPNQLTRVPVAFDREPLEGVLAPFRGLTAPIGILEGVLPYLSVAEVEALLRAIRGTFANTTLICDMTTTRFIRRYAGRIGKRPLGATLGDTLTKPHNEGGLYLGRITSSLVLAGITVIGILLTERRAAREPAPAGPGTA